MSNPKQGIFHFSHTFFTIARQRCIIKGSDPLMIRPILCSAALSGLRYRMRNACVLTKILTYTPLPTPSCDKNKRCCQAPPRHPLLGAIATECRYCLRRCSPPANGGAGGGPKVYLAKGVELCSFDGGRLLFFILHSSFFIPIVPPSTPCGRVGVPL